MIGWVHRDRVTGFRILWGPVNFNGLLPWAPTIRQILVIDGEDVDVTDRRCDVRSDMIFVGGTHEGHEFTIGVEP